MRYIILFLTICACTKELKYTKEELYKMARVGDPAMEFILPKSMDQGVQCSDYTEGCVSGHTVKIKHLEMIAVEFDSEAHAIAAAKKIRGYYTRNWVFDDATGEPTLEEFVQKYLEAKRP